MCVIDITIHFPFAIFFIHYKFSQKKKINMFSSNRRKTFNNTRRPRNARGVTYLRLAQTHESFHGIALCVSKGPSARDYSPLAQSCVIIFVCSSAHVHSHWFLPSFSRAPRNYDQLQIATRTTITCGLVVHGVHVRVSRVSAPCKWVEHSEVHVCVECTNACIYIRNAKCYGVCGKKWEKA